MAITDPIQALAALVAALPGIAREAVLEAVERAEAEARQTTAFTDQTGRLRASIRSGIERETHESVTGVLVAGAQDGVGQQAPSFDYAPFVEFGTSRKAPRPFLSPVAQTMQVSPDRIRQGFARVLA